MRVDEKIRAVETHVCGEPGRVIVDGVHDVPGDSVFAKMQYLQSEADWLRQVMLREPRGYPASNCNLIVPSPRTEADAGFVIMQQVEYPAMSGTNTIAVATVLIESGLVAAEVPVTSLTLDSPAGLITVTAGVERTDRGPKVRSVRFENVPAFAVALDHEIEVPGLGSVVVDVAWGGMFFVIADAESLAVELSPENAGEIASVCERIKAVASEQIECIHPENPEIRNITIGQLSAPADHAEAQRKNAVVVSTGRLDWNRPTTWTGALDRSPCGTGTCAKMATLWAKGELELGRDFVHEGILGTLFTGRLIRETQVGGRRAVVPTLEGRAYVTATSEYVIDPEDPFPRGFVVGDIWGGGD